MQERLHLQNHPGINPQPFRSKVVSIAEDSIILDQSFCYPKGGGQPGDIGTLSSQGITANFSEVHARELIHHPVNDVSIFEIGQRSRSDRGHALGAGDREESVSDGARCLWLQSWR